MKIELIKKYKAEFDYWLNDGELLALLDGIDEDWFFVTKDTAIWNYNYLFPIKYIVINDEYVDFRKALAEGKTVQVSDGGITGIAKWVDIENTFIDFEELIKNKKPLNQFRIKPEEPQFKVGDFVRVKSPSGETFVSVITSINKDNTATLNNDSVAYLCDCTKWTSQAGELCWFTITKEREIATLRYFNKMNGDRYEDSTYTDWYFCEPFLNSKPSWFKA